MTILNIENLIEKEVTLPSPPVIAVQILQTVQSDNADLKKLVEIISTDPVLTVKMIKIANNRLNSLVYIDALTNLYNHRYFQESLDNELLRAQRYNSVVSLLIFDIDHFKKVNDSYGHPAGDKVLSNIAVTIKNTVRPSDIVARYGGEEFAVILPETDFTGVKVFAARLRRCVEGVTTQAENHQIKVTISVGGTTFYPDKHICDKNLLFKIADQGLYMSKETGRNRITILAADDILSPDNN